ncbi:MAG: hypothetical protein IJZ82_06065 [Lachnospiraceae bacterium]|nr:hypothetical protein [Lachnospiraceae bacterium]
MVDKILLDYVRQLYILEEQKYTLVQIISKLTESVNIRKGMLQKENVETVSNNNLSQPFQEETKTGAKVAIGFGILFFLVGLESGAVFFVIASILFICGFSSMYYITKSNEEMRLRIENENREKIRKTEEAARNRLIEIRKNNAHINSFCSDAMKKVEELEVILAKKKDILSKLYGCDIIHTNYRNFYGISKIFYLLDTGICDTLTGVNGAYSQMRTDQIIDNQKVSIELQQRLLVTNQLMYNAIDRTNNLLKNIDSKQSDYSQILDNINSNIEMQNFISQSNAENVKAINSSVEYLAFAEKQRRLADGHYY